jgi:hypothetical protein
VTILPRTRTGGQNGNVRGLFVYVEKSHVISFPLNRVALIFQVSVRTVQKVLAEKKSGKPYQPALKSGRKVVVEFSFK